MPKRKQVVDSEEDEAFETPSEDERPKKSKQKAKATVKKPKFDDSDSEQERPMKSKKATKGKEKAESSAKSVKDTPSDSVEVDSNGDKYIELGKKKRATVRSFKGQSFVDIREYYGQEGDEKPGKKGISLSPEQWETLKSGADTIDVLLAKLLKK